MASDAQKWAAGLSGEVFRWYKKNVANDLSVRENFHWNNIQHINGTPPFFKIWKGSKRYMEHWGLWRHLFSMALSNEVIWYFCAPSFRSKVRIQSDWQRLFPLIGVMISWQYCMRPLFQEYINERVFCNLLSTVPGLRTSSGAAIFSTTEETLQTVTLNREFCMTASASKWNSIQKRFLPSKSKFRFLRITLQTLQSI